MDSQEQIQRKMRHVLEKKDLSENLDRIHQNYVQMAEGHSLMRCLDKLINESSRL